MSLYLFAYDIADHRRRHAIAKTLLGYGHRVQESVFELALDAGELDDVRIALATHLTAEDRFDIYPIDDRPDRRRYRWRRAIEPWDAVRLL